MFWLDIVTLIISLLGIHLHIFGIYLLSTDSSLRCKQKFFILNLSIWNIFLAVKSVINFICLLTGMKETLDHIFFFGQGLNAPFYSIMVALTLERFLEVYLNIHYKNSLFEKNKEWICITSWCLGLGIFVYLSIYYHSVQFDIRLNKSVNRIVQLSLSFVVITEFCFVYGYIFVKLRNGRQRTESRATRTRNQRIFVPFFVVLSYIFFVAVPDFILVFYNILEKYAILFYRINVIFDALIYLFMQPTLRRKLFKKTRNLNNDNITTSIATSI